MNDLSQRIASLSPTQRTLLLEKLRERERQSVSSPKPTAERRHPHTETQQLLAGLWANLLGTSDISLDDDFFELGGHSLLATRLSAHLAQTFNFEVPVEAVFRHPTIAALADHIEAAPPGVALMPPIERAPRDEPIPLSFSQQRVWFLHKLNPASTAYHVPRCIEIEGSLDLAALEATFTEIIARHEILRTSFPSVDGTPVQRIRAASPFKLPRVDLSHVADPAAHRSHVDAYWREEGQKPFDLESGSLIRFVLLSFSPEKHYLLLIEHHLVHDGWTQGVLLRELITLYNAFTKGLPSPLPELPIQFADYAVWQRRWMDSPAGEAQLAFWRKTLADLPDVFGLPLDKPRPATLKATGDQLIVMIPGDLASALRLLAQAEGVTLFMVLLTAFDVLLARYARTSDVWVGSGVANRRRKEMETMMGMVVNNIILRTDLSGNPSFADALKRVRSTSLEAYANQDIAFDRVVQAVNPSRSLRHSPLFQTMFSFHDSPAPLLRMDGLRVRGRDLKVSSAKFDINVVALPYREQKTREDAPKAGAHIWTSWEYSTEVLERATIEAMSRHFLALLEAAVLDPGCPIDRLAMMNADERAQIVAEGAAVTPSAQRPCLHEAFVEHARTQPDAVAVTSEAGPLTYGELHRQSNQLSHELRAAGVCTETVVGLLLERSPRMLVAMLAVLKAGGAYLPIDPRSPVERVDFMLEDSKVGLVITEASLSARLTPNGQSKALCLDGCRDSIASRPTDMPRVAVSPHNLAYVIYTSGSTGRPKGVMVTHENVSRLFDAASAAVSPMASDVWTMFHSFAFDFSVWEIWGALLHGGRLVIVPHDVARAPARFLALLRREGVTMLSQTPSAFAELARADANGDDPLRLRAIVFGGEKLETRSLAPWLKRHGDACPKLYNMYGITETTVHVTFKPIVAAAIEETGASVVGRPLADLSCFVLDDYLEPVPRGAWGELFVGGAGLARGYRHRPSLTASWFVPNPFCAGERLYRTGDIVRRNGRGDLEYGKRSDLQVKVRGYRVELGEIESELTALAGVAQACVIAKGQSPSEISLHAYVVMADHRPQEEADVDRLLPQLLRKRLPEYMIPATVNVLQTLPLNASGKVDRSALAALDLRRRATAFVEPGTEEEMAIAAIWSDVLSVERVGAHDNFFDLGGHSLMAMRIINRIDERFASKLTIGELFNAPTVSEQAALVAKEAWEEIVV